MIDKELIKKTEKALLKLGYVTQIHNSINSLTIALPDEELKPSFGTTSRIEIVKNNFIYTYFDGQLPIEKSFESIEDLINFIKEKYPIKQP